MSQRLPFPVETNPGKAAGNGDATTTIKAPLVDPATVPSATTADPGAGVGEGTGNTSTSVVVGDPGAGALPTLESSVIASSSAVDSSQSSSLAPATSTVSSNSQKTSKLPIDSSSPKSNGLSTGAKAGIAVGILVLVLILLGGLFLWWRRRKQKANKHGRGDDADIPELDGAKKAQMLDSRMLPAELTGSSGPTPAELADQNTLSKTSDANDFKELKMGNDPIVVAAELPEKDTSRSSPSTEPHTEAVRYEMDSNQQPKSPPPPPIVRKQIPEPVHNPQPVATESPASPDTQVSPIPDTSTEPVSPPLTEAVSLPSPSVANGSMETQEMLMEEYARSEARRQRILELKKIEEEQEALQARLKKMSSKDAK